MRIFRNYLFEWRYLQASCCNDLFVNYFFERWNFESIRQNHRFPNYLFRRPYLELVWKTVFWMDFLEGWYLQTTCSADSLWNILVWKMIFWIYFFEWRDLKTTFSNHVIWKLLVWITVFVNHFQRQYLETICFHEGICKLLILKMAFGKFGFWMTVLRSYLFEWLYF